MTDIDIFEPIERSDDSRPNLSGKGMAPSQGISGQIFSSSPTTTSTSNRSAPTPTPTPTFGHDPSLNQSMTPVFELVPLNSEYLNMEREFSNLVRSFYKLDGGLMLMHLAIPTTSLALEQAIEKSLSHNYNYQNPFEFMIKYKNDNGVVIYSYRGKIKRLWEEVYIVSGFPVRALLGIEESWSLFP